MKEDRTPPLAAASDEFADPAVERTSNAPYGEQPGDQIGRYRLVEEIGEGGMGTVWLAEQREPVRRQVALKVIKLGMDTREVVARFEAERQALAVMDHPNIAKVLDGGATAQGRPFFVMELVRGVPITEYAERAKLGLRERLELFVRACDAIQHAHQKGIIHRDIKPSNVLVALRGETAEPKVIDFGIAKATGSELTQRTMFTKFAQIVGTPEYMAPEQADGNATDVDTRADVYSLGVLLYELLTGSKPFDIRTALSAGFDELLRTIREVDPVKPSTRVSSMHGDQGPIGGARHVNVEALSKRLRGDLDWIVMKALEKNRARRYDSASGFAADVSRFLTGDAVLAAPPSALYKLRKTVRRHRGAFVSGGVALALLVLGAAGTTVGLIRAERTGRLLQAAVEEKSEALEEETRQRELALANLARAVEAEALAKENAEAADARRAQAEGHANLALGTMQFALVSVANRLRDVPQTAELRESILQDMIERFDALEVSLTEGGVDGEAIPTLMAIKNEVARIHADSGQTERALEELEELTDIARRRVVIKQGSTTSRFNLARILHDHADLQRKLSGDTEESLALKREAVDVLSEAIANPSGIPGEPSMRSLKANRAESLQAIGADLLRLGRIEEAAAQFERALRTVEELLEALRSAPGFDDLSDAQKDQRTYAMAMDVDRSRLALAYALLRLGRTDEALPMYRSAVESRREIAARYPLEERPSMASLHSAYGGFAGNLAGSLLWIRRLEEAEPLVEGSLRASTAVHALDPASSSNVKALALAWYRKGTLLDLQAKTEESRAAFEEARGLLRVLVDADGVLDHRRRLMLAHARCGAIAAAEELARRQESEEHLDGDAHIDRARCYAQLSRHAISDTVRDEYVTRAIQALEAAADDGFGDAFRVRSEPDLIPLLEREEFEALLERF